MLPKNTETVESEIKTAEATEVEVEEVAETTQVAGDTSLVEEVDAEPSPEQSLYDALGEIPETANAKLLEGLTPKQLAALPDDVKGIVKHFMAGERAKAAASIAKAEAREQALLEREAAQAQNERDLIDRQAQLAAVFQSDAIKAMLAEADNEDEIDVTSPEGIKAYLDRETAKKMREFSKATVESAERVQKTALYRTFVDEHPKMNDAAFRSRVKAEVEKGHKLAQAYQNVDYEDMRTAQQAQREADRAARAKSAQHVQRTTTSSDPGAEGGGIPDQVKREGYKGKRGPAATIAYLRDHPKAQAAILSRNNRRP